VTHQNHILTSLTPADYGLIGAHLEHVELPFRYPLEAPHRPIEYVYFPEAGLVSVVAQGGRDHDIEVGVIGFDGMTGTSVLLGADRTPNSLYMQIAGRGKRIAVDRLIQAVAASPSLNKALLLFVQAFMVQASQTALANGRGKLETRLARWLLMAHDRLNSNDLALTHEYLSVMLGVRRPGVTVALQKLEGSGFIGTGRGVITVKNRAGLEAIAEGIYGTAEGEQERLTGWRRLHRNGT
jgi:CRP-like cAMP-binding protein